MKQYTPPFSLTNAMLLRAGSISEKLGYISALQLGELSEKQIRTNRIRAVHASTKIESNALDLQQAAAVLAGQAVMAEDRDIQELKNAFSAYQRLDKLDPFSLSELLKLHGVMTQGLIKDGGAFRQCAEGVFNGERCVFMAPPPRMVPKLMDDLFAWLNAERGHCHSLILAAVFHYEFVFIHPFADGNGRMARLWHTALLAAWKPLFASLPLEEQVLRRQQEYYQVIAECNQAGSSELFIEFMLGLIDELLDELLLPADK